MIAAALLLLLAEPVVAADPLLTEMQQLESSRNAAIKAGDMATLEKLYAPDFTGIAGNGTRVDRPTLFSVFKRNAGGDFTADSRILTARKLGKGLVAVEGRLRLTNSAGATISDSNYLHIFRRNGRHWEMVEGAAVPIAGPAR
jgi:hypothetical protein